jgi:ribosomal protein S1
MNISISQIREQYKENEKVALNHTNCYNSGYILKTKSFASFLIDSQTPLM